MSEPRQTWTAEALLEHVHWVHALARSLVHDVHQAEDLAQEALLAALKSPPAEPEGLRAWLATVLRRRAISGRRSDSRRARRERRAAIPERLPSEDDLLERAELQRSLVNAVMALREPYRALLLLRFFEGYTPAEIAAERHTTPATVRSQIGRALELLRERLDRGHGGRRAWISPMAAFVALPPKSLIKAGQAAAPAATSAATGGAAAATLSGLALGGIAMKAQSILISIVLGGLLVGGAYVLWPRTPTPDAPGEADVQPFAGGVAGVETAAPAAPGGPGAVPAEPEPVAPVTATQAVDGPPPGRIEGVVTDATGAPLEGIVLHAIPQPEGHAHESTAEMPFGRSISIQLTGSPGAGDSLPEIDDPTGRALSDGRGRYRISGLDPGPYRVLARGGGFRQQIKSGLEVVPDGSTWVDLQLDEGLAIEGIVLDPEDRPVAAAEVATSGNAVDIPGAQFLFLAGGDRGITGGHGEVRAISGDDGRFRLEGLASGSHLLTVTHEAWAPGFAPNIAAGSSEVELRVTEGAQLSGVVLDPGGNPVAGAEVSTMSFLGPSGVSATASGDGRFILERVSAGPITLRAEAPGFPAAQSSRYKVEDGDTLEEIEIRFEEGATLAGRVLDPEGIPLEGATVAATRSRKRRFLPDMTSIPRPGQVQSGLDGRFEIGGLHAGAPYDLVVREERYLKEELEEVIAGEGRTELGDIRMRRGATLRGLVRDAPSGRPIAGATVRLAPHRPEQQGAYRMMELTMGGLGSPPGARATSGEDGIYELSPIERGDYVLRVTADGYTPLVSDPITVATGDQTVECNLDLGVGLVITGRVVDRRGDPLAGAHVEAMGFMAGFFRASATAGDSGDFSIRGLEAGDYVVKATFGALSPASLEGVPAGGTPVELMLLDQGALSGAVFDMATRRPIEEFTVRLDKNPESGAFSIMDFSLSDLGDGSRFTSPDGEFQMRNVDPGSYTVRITAEGFVIHEIEDLEIPAGETVDLEVPMDIGGALEGFVKDITGHPVAGAEVRREAGGPRRHRAIAIAVAGDVEEGGQVSTVFRSDKGKSARTDENGHFLLSGLPVGEIDVSISHEGFMDRTLEKVEVVRGQTRRLEDVELLRGARIHGIVRRADGSVVTGGGVMIFPVGEGAMTPKFVQIGKDGRYEQGGLEAGRYRLEAHAWDVDGDGEEITMSAGGGDDGQYDLELGPDEEREFDIVID